MTVNLAIRVTEKFVDHRAEPIKIVWPMKGVLEELVEAFVIQILLAVPALFVKIEYVKSAAELTTLVPMNYLALINNAQILVSRMDNAEHARNVTFLTMVSSVAVQMDS